MRREWLIVAAVLVPFTALVAAAFLFKPQPSLEPAPTPPRSAPPPRSPEPTIRPAALPLSDAAPTLPSLAEPPSVPPALEAPIRAVSGEVHACFVDNGAHLHGRVEVAIRFEPTRDGGFRAVSLDTPIADPRLQACLEDVFDQMTFEPTGRETFEPARHTFIFDATPQ